MNDPDATAARETSFAASIRDVERVLRTSDTRAWLVGGTVRDLLLGQVPRDVDLVVEGDAHRVAETLAAELGWAVTPLHARTVRLVPRHSNVSEIDVSSLAGGTLDDDLRRRDFSINAIAVPLSAWERLLRARASERPTDDVPLLDPLGGLRDLHARQLVAASDSAFRADPGRVLRAATAIARLDLTPDARTERLARESVPSLASLSADRLREEMSRLLDADDAGRGLRWLIGVGAYDPLAPGSRAEQWSSVASALDQIPALVFGRGDVPSDEGAWGHAVDALRAWYAETRAGAEPRLTGLRWGVLLYALADGSLRQGNTALPFTPRGHLGLVARTTAQLVPRALDLLRSGVRDEVAWRWFFADTQGDGEAGVHAIVGALAVASAGGRNAASEQSRALAGWVLTTYLTDRTRLVPPPLLSGRDVIEKAGVAPGPNVGDILTAVRAAQLNGTVTTEDDALDFARTLTMR